MKRLTLQEAREEIRARELWLERQRQWGHALDFDADLEETGLQAPGAAAGYWDIPNR